MKQNETKKIPDYQAPAILLVDMVSDKCLAQSYQVGIQEFYNGDIKETNEIWNEW